jgi:hypothetical protein
MQRSGETGPSCTLRTVPKRAFEDYELCLDADPPASAPGGLLRPRCRYLITTPSLIIYLPSGNASPSFLSVLVAASTSSKSARGPSALAESRITVITGAWATVADGSTTGARWSRPGHDRCAAPQPGGCHSSPGDQRRRLRLPIFGLVAAPAVATDSRSASEPPRWPHGRRSTTQKRIP